ncbi:MAG: Holliday junction resolvase RuvX [Fibrobacteria bacterium]|nr:Holliday junction resolvase RuvX [Fibrobacteria bacterium]
MPRFLGIDWGARRIGVALSDLEGQQAFGYCTLDTARGDTLREIARICEDEDVDEIVIGLPLRTDTGEESDSSRAVRQFADQLAPLVKRRISFEDEGFTSFAAEQGLKAGGWKASKTSKAQVDKAAAKVLLQDHLNRRARGEVE